MSLWWVDAGEPLYGQPKAVWQRLRGVMDNIELRHPEVGMEHPA